jgi:predicted transcriptional regulator
MNIVAKQSYFKLDEVLSDYFEVIENVDLILKESGYKTSYVAKKLNMPPSTFYLKKKQRSFTPQELRTLVDIIDVDDDDDPEYLAYEKQIIESRKGGEEMDYEDFKKEHGLK